MVREKLVRKIPGVVALGLRKIIRILHRVVIGDGQRRQAVSRRVVRKAR